MWQYIPAVMTAIGAISSASSASKQNKNQRSWNQYNATMQYNTAMGNIQSQTAIAGLNFAMTSQAAALQRQLAGYQYGLSQQSAEMEKKKAAFNAAILTDTIQYNNSLLDAEIADVWESSDLDVLLLANQRSVERGQIGAQQAGSGVVMGQDSAADVMIDSMTQEALDVFVVRHGAADKVNDINNQMSKNVYEGRLAVSKLMWEGELNSYNIMLGARANYASGQIAASNTLLQGAANYGSAMIAADANKRSAQSALYSGMMGADFGYNYNQQSIKNNLSNALFSAIGMGAGTYFNTKQPQSNYNPFGTTMSAPVNTTTLVTSGNSSSKTPYKFSTGYQGQYSLATPGVSLNIGI